MQVPEPLRALGWELPHTFLGLDEDASDFDSAAAVILPVPYEATTSWGGGTAAGPRAIVEASRYIELYDQELDVEPADAGVATLPALELTRAGPAEAMAELRQAYDAVLDAAGPERLVILLGGEHAVSGPAILAWADRLGGSPGPAGADAVADAADIEAAADAASAEADPEGSSAGAREEAVDDGRRLSVLQIDAHADLRPEYEGTPHSHASVMHRVHDRVDITAVGIRSLTRDERELADGSDSIRHFPADAVQDDDGWIDDVIGALGDDVYLTFDVDGFDPSLVPSTGTPEPGGLAWHPVLRLLRRVFRERNVLACDVVELAPIPALRAPDFLVAKLVYKLIAYGLRR